MCPLFSASYLEMAFEEHDALAGSQVPHSAEAVKAAAGGEGAVLLEGQAVDLLAVALLVEDLGQLLQVP